ncbi:MAG: LysR family transcriptional regulator [Ideonella sp.]|jgi:DNA-binding transcriptional LysR family regulator|nr:LysR family transcriptional regulator [Ideonella sp.]
MPAARNVLTPEALAMIDTIARTGSFAAAARELGKVPSALTYNVRQLEDALDVLLFDRRSRQARLTPAGTELLHEGRRLLEQVDAVANRVRRVGTGWETQLTIAADDIMSRSTLFELCDAFYALRPTVRGLEGTDHSPGTRLRLRTEVLAGTWEALVTGAADVAIGVSFDGAPPGEVAVEPLGDLSFVFAVAPHHPLAAGGSPLSDAELVHHRAVAVADSAQRLTRITVNLLPGQDVLTVPTMRDKLEAQLRGLGCGFLPEPIARPHLEAGRLVARDVLRPRTTARLAYAWRCGTGPRGQRAPLGLALQWWLEQLRSPATRRALIERQAGPLPGP